MEVNNGRAEQLDLKPGACSPLLQPLQLRRSDLGRFTGGIFLLNLLVDPFRLKRLFVRFVGRRQFKLRRYPSDCVRRFFDQFYVGIDRFFVPIGIAVDRSQSEPGQRGEVFIL